MIGCPSIEDLPYPPDGKQGWPWTIGVEAAGGGSADSLLLNEDQRQLMPCISIVIPSYNQGCFLEETIRSVLLQNYPKIELIIIDGGSDDESVHIIQRYSRWLKKWISESDRGQSHAINKGLRYCAGEIFNWLNSDDSLAPGALHAVASGWMNNPCAIITGQVMNFDNDGHEALVTPRALSLKNFIDFRSARQEGMTWHQPGTFLPREKVVEAGGVQEDLEFNMDHFLMIDLLRVCEVVILPNVLAKFRLHENSKTVADGFLEFRLERIRRLRKVGDIYMFVSENEIKNEHISLIFAKTDLPQKVDLRRKASLYLEAFSVSPPLASICMIRRSSIFKFVKKIIYKFKKLCCSN
jgi:glycosyltransferase involved in cell wall biosynthesis